MTRFVQPLITDEQAVLLTLALQLILEDEDKFVMTADERDQYEKLAVFFGLVAQNPLAFPPTGRNAATVKKIVRRAKGSAQPRSRSSRRKTPDSKERRYGS